jgi:membrane protease YdiL (CAAX protease family)
MKDADMVKPWFSHWRYAFALLPTLWLAVRGVVLFIENQPIAVPLTSREFIVMGFVQTIIFILVALFLQPNLWQQLRSFRFNRTAYFGLLGGCFALNYLQSLLGQALMIPERQPVREYPTLISAMSSAEQWLFLLTMLLVGYSEEIFFRALPISFVDKHPTSMMILWLLLFGALHIDQGLMGAFFALFTGLIFWQALLKQVSLHTVALVHATYNLTIALLIILL